MESRASKPKKDPLVSWYALRELEAQLSSELAR